MCANLQMRKEAKALKWLISQKTLQVLYRGGGIGYDTVSAFIGANIYKQQEGESQ